MKRQNNKEKKPQSLKITANNNGISSKDKNGKFGINSDGSVYWTGTRS